MSTINPNIEAEAVSWSKLEEFFVGIDSRRHQVDEMDDAVSFSRIELGRFFREAGQKLAAFEQSRLRHDKALATGFNVFQFIEPDENRLSDVLAFLLNPKESHGQGDLFLRLMFRQLRLVVDTKHTQRATVRREAATHNILNHRRRMDILVEAGAWLAIENKIDSAEQPEQVKDYLEHLHYYACDRAARAALIYLSPNGRLPESISASEIETLNASGTLHCWSYQEQLRQWLERCRRDCAAPRIRNFLTDLMQYIEVQYQREPIGSRENEDYEE